MSSKRDYERTNRGLQRLVPFLSYDDRIDHRVRGPERGAAAAPRSAVVRVLRGGEDAAARPGRRIGATAVREPL